MGGGGKGELDVVRIHLGGYFQAEIYRKGGQQIFGASNDNVAIGKQSQC